MSRYEEKYNSKEWREHLKELSDRSLKDHVLIKEGEGRWYCQKPGTNMYSFRVVVSANAILFHGDLRDLCIQPSGPDPLGWLVNTLTSQYSHVDYFMEKVTPIHRTQRVFLVKTAYEQLEGMREEPQEALEIAEKIREIQQQLDKIDQQMAEIYKEKGDDFDGPEIVALENLAASLKDDNFEILMYEENLDLSVSLAKGELEKVNKLETVWKEKWDHYENTLIAGSCPPDQAWYEANYEVYEEIEGISCDDWDAQLMHQYYALKKFAELYQEAERADSGDET